MKRIELSDDEIKVLIGMIDVAVRAQGLNVAANAVHLAGKLQNAKEVEDVVPFDDDLSPDSA